MKACKVSGSLSALLALAACDVQPLEQAPLSDAQDLEDVTAPASFHAGVGAPIDAALGARWIANHRQTAGEAFDPSLCGAREVPLLRSQYVPQAAR